MQEEQLKLYIRNHTKRAKILFFNAKLVSNAQLIDKVAKFLKRQQQSQQFFLFYKGRPILSTPQTKDSIVTLTEKSIIHVVQRQNLLKQCITIQIKVAQKQQKNQKICKSSAAQKIEIRNTQKLGDALEGVAKQIFLKENAFQSIEQYSRAYVYLGHQIDLNRTFQEQLIEDNSQILCIFSKKTVTKKLYPQIQEQRKVTSVLSNQNAQKITKQTPYQHERYIHSNTEGNPEQQKCWQKDIKKEQRAFNRLKQYINEDNKRCNIDNSFDSEARSTSQTMNKEQIEIERSKQVFVIQKQPSIRERQLMSPYNPKIVANIDKINQKLLENILGNANSSNQNSQNQGNSDNNDGSQGENKHPVAEQLKKINQPQAESSDEQHCENEEQQKIPVKMMKQCQSNKDLSKHKVQELKIGNPEDQKPCKKEISKLNSRAEAASQFFQHEGVYCQQRNAGIIQTAQTLNFQNHELSQKQKSVQFQKIKVQQKPQESNMKAQDHGAEGLQKIESKYNKSQAFLKPGDLLYSVENSMTDPQSFFTDIVKDFGKLLNNSSEQIE